jgi:hypothetical protein
MVTQKVLFGIIFSFVVCAFSSFFFYREYKELSIFKENGKIAIGEVYRIDTLKIPEGYTRSYLIKFITENNEKITTTNTAYSDNELYKLNDKIKVIYQENNPGNSRIYSDLEMKKLYTFLLISLISFLYFIINIVFFNKIVRFFDSV